jgi:hypothetical protein
MRPSQIRPAGHAVGNMPTTSEDQRTSRQEELTAGTGGGGGKRPSSSDRRGRAGMSDHGQELLLQNRSA